MAGIARSPSRSGYRPYSRTAPISIAARQVPPSVPPTLRWQPPPSTMPPSVAAPWHRRSLKCKSERGRNHALCRQYCPRWRCPVVLRQIDVGPGKAVGGSIALLAACTGSDDVPVGCNCDAADGVIARAEADRYGQSAGTAERSVERRCRRVNAIRQNVIARRCSV